jgi:hypothetical protein
MEELLPLVALAPPAPIVTVYGVLAVNEAVVPGVVGNKPPAPPPPPVFPPIPPPPPPATTKYRYEPEFVGVNVPEEGNL